jgi:hypothetical protein
VLQGGADGFRRGLELEAGGGGDDLGGCGWANGLGAAELEALATEHGTALRGLEGDRGLDVALRALGTSLGADETCGRGDATGAGSSAEDGALGLAGLAAFWVVFELPIKEEDLLAGSKDKLPVAIHAGKKSVDELCLHRILRRAGKGLNMRLGQSSGAVRMFESRYGAR